MENKKEDKQKRGRPAKEKAKLSTSINLKLTEEDFKMVKVTMFALDARRDGCSRPLPLGVPRAMSICRVRKRKV